MMWGKVDASAGVVDVVRLLLIAYSTNQADFPLFFLGLEPYFFSLDHRGDGCPNMFPLSVIFLSSRSGSTKVHSCTCFGSDRHVVHSHPTGSFQLRFLPIALRYARYELRQVIHAYL